MAAIYGQSYYGAAIYGDSSSSPTKRKFTGMGNDYIPRSMAAYAAWLLNIESVLPTEGPKFALSSTENTATVALCVAQKNRAQTTADAEAALASARELEKAGKITTDAALRGKIGGWKEMVGWTDANGAALKVIGSATDFDPDAHKPEFKVKVVGGEIRLDWKKGGSKGVNIYARLRGVAGWTKIGMDTSSPYIDGRPLATEGVPEVREYMLRGLIDDAEIGLDSDVLSVTWGG